MKLSDLATQLGATLHGDPDVEITSAAGLEEALPGQITFVANPKYIPLARTTKASAVLVDPAFEQITAATLRLENPYLAFARALELLYEAPAYAPGIHPTAVIAPTAKIGASTHRSLRRRWQPRRTRRSCNIASPRSHLSQRSHRQPFFRACARGSS